MWKPFKRKIEIPEFKNINKYIDREKYFIRTKKWDWLNSEQIFVAVKNKNGNPKMITMEFWDQEMFLDATGEIKIKDYLNKLIEQYLDSKMKIPKDLDEFMIKTLESLKNELELIKFIDKKEKLKPEYELPLSEVNK